MPNTVSEIAGPIRISIGFFDVSKYQGWWGKVTQLVAGSKITHVAPIFHYGSKVTITLLPDRGAKVHRLSVLQDCLIDEIDTGEHIVDFELVSLWASDYANTSVKDAVFYNFIGRFFGLTRPRVCTTLVCDLLGLPEFWHPAKLYNYMKGNA